MPPASIAAAWEKAFGVSRPRNDLMDAVESASSMPSTTWDAAFKVHTPVERYPEMPAAEQPEPTKASTAAAWEKAFGVSRPRNDLMDAVESASSIPSTTWDAAFKVHTPVERYPETAAELPEPTKASTAAAWDEAFNVSRPRNDLMDAVELASSIPSTTWDAAFKVHTLVERYPEMP